MDWSLNYCSSQGPPRLPRRRQVSRLPPTTTNGFHAIPPLRVRLLYVRLKTQLEPRVLTGLVLNRRWLPLLQLAVVRQPLSLHPVGSCLHPPTLWQLAARCP